MNKTNININKSIKIVQMNVRSVNRNQVAIAALLELESPSVFMMGETWLNKPIKTLH